MLGRTVDHKITRIKEFHDSSLMRGDRPECPLWVGNNRSARLSETAAIGQKLTFRHSAQSEPKGH